MSICDDCKYVENDSNEIPCNVCMQWVDGYLSATEYLNKGVLTRRE